MSAFFSGLWAKIKADAVNAWALLGELLATLVENIDSVAAQFGDPNLTQQISTLVHADVVWMAAWTQVVSGVVIAARLHKLIPSPAPKV